jgi:hypothetical protein
MSALSDPILDAILAVQITVAWAGEGRCQPKRLGWWDTDVIDPEGGGDFFARLLPQTARWAGLEAAREAARRVDKKARAKMANADEVRTIFFLGFEIDEQIADRLAALKREAHSPVEALRIPIPLGSSFDRESVANAMGSDAPSAFTVVPGGRKLTSPMPKGPDDAVRALASALVPFAEHYPLPFFSLREPRPRESEGR